MEEKLQELNETIERCATADLYLERGRLLWRMQRQAAAMADYGRAAAIAGPGSPAAAALEMARQVMDFYNKNMYNP